MGADVVNVEQEAETEVPAAREAASEEDGVREGELD